MLLEDKDETLLTSIGIQVNENVTEPVELIDYTDTAITILLVNDNAVRLSRSLIASILYLSPDQSTSASSTIPITSPVPP